MTIHVQDRCVPSELPSLLKVLPDIHILSPNALEACALLSLPCDAEPSRELIETAAMQLYNFGVGGADGLGAVLIRSGELGVLVQDSTGKLWIDAYFQSSDVGKVVDVTGMISNYLFYLLMTPCRCWQCIPRWFGGWTVP